METPPICDYEASTYRTDFWHGRGREYEDAVERVALRRLLPPQGHRLIDIGAGFGRLANLYTGYREVILVDYSRSQLEYARQQLGDGRFLYVAADLYRLPIASHAADAVVMVRVLHHIANVPLAFQQISRTLKPQGVLVLEFANKRHLKNILRYLLRRGMNPFTLEPYEFAPLHFDFHPQWVYAQLDKAHFAREKVLSVSLFRSGWLKRHIPTGWLVALETLFQEPAAPLTPGPSVFVRARRQGQPETPCVSRERLFRCPRCHHEPLLSEHDGLACPQCGAHWPIINGIHVFKEPIGD